MNIQDNPKIKEKADELLSEMPIGNAKIYAMNMSVYTTQVEKAKFWAEVVNYLNKTTTGI